MAKKILLIENDSSFAAGLAESLEAAGFEARATGDGKEGLDLARDWAPAAVVLCVELPGMSGYLVCQKLKKDDELKNLPLVLTSAEATEETFEKHRTLKARADEYLLKPYTAEALVEKLGALVGLPEGAAPEEELVTLEEEVGIEASAEGSPDQELPGLDLESLHDEPPAGSSAEPGDDDDLKLLDDAFDGIAAPAPKDAAAALDDLTGERPVQVDDVDAAAASLPEEDEGSAHADFGALDAEAEAALGALGADDETLSPGLGIEPEPPTRPVRGASAESLRAAGVRLLDEEPTPRGTSSVITPPPPAPAGGAAEVERELGGSRDALQRTRSALAEREAQVRELEAKVRKLERRAADAEAEAERSRGKAESAGAQLRKAEAEIRHAVEQAKAAETEAASLEEKLAEAERRARQAEADAHRKAEEAAAAAEAVAKAEALEREADELRTELLVARGEAEGARNEVEKRTADLKKRVVEVEAAAQKNEERVVKAYQKIKADEKVREKIRKALAIAMQLIEEGLPAAESPAEKERRAALGGRE